MDGFVARSDLIAGERLKALSRRSDALGFARLAGHGIAIAGTAGLLQASLGTAWSLPAALLYGVVLIFLFAPLHETIHRTAFRARRLNDALAWFAGLVLVLPPHYFRLFHFAHHRYTQDPALDPELAGPKPERLGQLLSYVSGVPYWRERLTTTVRHALGRVTDAFVPARERAVVVAEARVVLAVYTGIALLSVGFSTWAPVIYWVVPAVLGQPALRLFLLAEHAGCPRVPDMLANTRTTLSNALVRYLAWNMPFHAEHHLFPGVPFHALPAVHAEVRDRLLVLAPGYLSVHRALWSGRTRQAPAGAAGN